MRPIRNLLLNYDALAYRNTHENRQTICRYRRRRSLFSRFHRPPRTDNQQHLVYADTHALCRALCGLFLSWSYDLSVDEPSVAAWLRYNLLCIILLFLLGPISLVLFEPIMTIPVLLASPNGLPDELFQEVLPLVAVYIPLMALIITRLYRRDWTGFGVVLITCAVLVMLLGLNIATMGLVFLAGGWVRLLLELVGLVVALNLVYVAVYLLLERLWVGGTAVTAT